MDTSKKPVGDAHSHPLQSREAFFPRVGLFPSQSHVPPFSSMFPSLGLCPSYWILRLSCRLAIIQLSAKDQWDSKPWFSQHVMSKYG